MSYKKRVSTHYNKAVTRLASLKSINEKLDLGNGLTVPMYDAAINDFMVKLDTYNTHLSQIDGLKNAVDAGEIALKDLSERMLDGVASKFGKDTDEYEKAGGVKKSERKKPVRKKKSA